MGLEDGVTEVDGADFQNVRLRIAVDTPVKALPGSPLASSIAKTEVDPTVRSEDEMEFRGVIEILLAAEHLSFVSGQSGVNHIALTSDLGEAISDLSYIAPHGVLVSKNLPAGIDFLQGCSLPGDIESLSEVREFREAFADLHLDVALTDSQGFANQPRLVSKIDVYRHLQHISPDDWRSPIVRYVHAYERLVERADAIENDWFRFLVRHPFSVSIWNTSGEAARIAGVMISPYHPIRLAWLASVESVLREAEGRWTSFLAGGIVGWQFPYFSVSRHSAGRLIALPLDGGHEGLFAGWSVMVPVQVDGLRGLEIPQHAGDLRLPGVASDGLSASAVASATNKFFSLHPFMSSIAVDLSARSTTPKSEAVDSGLVNAVSEWRNSRLSRGLSPGGVTIFDNVNREGDVFPVVADLGGADDSPKSPFSWIRYEGQNPGQSVNIRILGDSGLNYVAGNPNGGLRTGSVGSALLRRYEVVGANPSGSGAFIDPGLAVGQREDELEQAFLGALCRHEVIPGAHHGLASPDFNTEPISGMRFEVHAGIASTAGADWIVGGDSALPPTVLSRMLRRDDSGIGAELTIWDWHPPMFGSSNTEVVGNIDLRPYVVVSKLTEAFKGRLDQVIRSCNPAKAGDNSAIAQIRSDVLETLGSRGVGISSLFANHKHKTPQRGAMGFWYVLDLLAKLSDEGREILAVPLDKIDRLMDALCGRPADDRRRADLLLIELSERSLRIAPVEIKFMRLDNPNQKLADPLGDDSELVSAFEQVSVANARCGEIVDQLTIDSVSERENRILRWNAMATLVDIGIRLSPLVSADSDRRRRVAGWLSSIASPGVDLKVGQGNPLVAYLEAHNGLTRSFVGMPVGRGAVLYQADPRDLSAIRSKGGTDKFEFDLAIDLVFPRSNESSETTRPSPCLAVVSPETREDSSVNKVSVTEDDHLTNLSVVGHRESDDRTQSNQVVNEDYAPITEVDSSAPMSPMSSDSGSLHAENLAQIEPDEGVRVLVGREIGTGSDVMFWPGNKELGNPNVGIVGEMGSGKTQLCLSLVTLLRQSANSRQATPIGGLILDPKGDYSRSDRGDFYEAAGVTVLEPYRLPVELVAIRPSDGPQDINLKISAFVDIFGRVLGRDFGALQRERLREAVKGVVELRKRSPLVSEIYTAYKLLVGDKRDTITSRLGELVDLGIFTDDPSELVPIEVLLEDKVVVLNLEGLYNHVSIQEQLMAIFINQFQTALRAQTKWPIRKNDQGVEIRRLNLFLLIDEASMVIRHDYKQLEDILRTGREYGVLTIMSSQFLSDFESSQIDYGQSLRSWFVHQQSQVSRKQLSDLGLPESVEVIERLRSMPVHECLFSTHPGPPIWMRGRPWYEVAAGVL